MEGNFVVLLSSHFHFIVSLIAVLFVWKWGDWENWERYYPTILFYVLGNFVYLYLTKDYPLWLITSPLFTITIVDLIIAFVFFPTTILLYLPYFPREGLIKQVTYVFLWVSIYSLWEWISLILNSFSYSNGWSYIWSVRFDIIMFPLLLLHHKKPLWGLVVAFIIGLFFMLHFNVPFRITK